MAESIVSSVAGRLGDLLIQEAKFLGGVGEQIELIKFELELMQGYLEDADKRQIKDGRVQTWVSRIRETAYDVEDIIETFALKIASRRRRGIQNKFKRYACITNEAAELHKVGSQIEAIKPKISILTRCLDTYGIKHIREGEGSISAYQRQRQLTQSYSHVIEDFTVALEEDVKTLVAELVNEENHYHVFSICGMGGLGKTTLAKKVYHDKAIRQRFGCITWTSVSQQYQAQDVWKGIRSQLTKDEEKKNEELNVGDVLKQLHAIQQKEKCLVILDDIWTIKAWEDLRAAFLVGKASIKILLTTCNEEVANHAKAFLYRLKDLTIDEAWQLLKKKAFQENGDPPGFVEGLGKEMVERCKRLPLAIVVLGGILATKRWDEWGKVNANINLYLRTGKGHEEQHFGGVYEVLALSYYELPYQLKPCFLHLAHFPEDFDIPIKKLVRMWVAEGIVSPMQVGGEDTLEDVAKGYLNKLMQRCMVQVGVTMFTGMVKTCRLHDLMRELCVSMANQENFLQIARIQEGDEPVVNIANSSCGVLMRDLCVSIKANQENCLSIACIRDGNEPMVNISNSSSRVHRLAIHWGEESKINLSSESERTSNLRSLMFFSINGTRIWQMMESKFRDFKLLKILDLGTCDSLPRAIGKLIHLRYLNIHISQSQNLPSSIGNLRYLQTLILHSYYSLIRIPNVIFKMEQLRHLRLPSCIENSVCRGKLQLGNLKYLQTLQRFDAERFDVKELIKSTDLKILEIRNLKSVEELEGILLSPRVTFTRLLSLKLKFGFGGTSINCIISPHHRDLNKLHLRGRIEKLPESSQFPPNLTKLSLWDSELEEDPMPTLEKLPKLSILHLMSDSFSGRRMVCSSEGFPELKSLLLGGLGNLEEWCVNKGAMPKLCEVAFENCRQLRNAPDGLRFIPTLRELKILVMHDVFLNSLREAIEGGGEDHYKDRHRPFIKAYYTFSD